MKKPKQKPAPAPTVEETIATRHETHGDFRNVAKTAQELKSIILMSYNFQHGKLTSLHMEGLEMICHKMARIMSGDPNFKEHWHDIAGYATRVEGMV